MESYKRILAKQFGCAEVRGGVYVDINEDACKEEMETHMKIFNDEKKIRIEENRTYEGPYAIYDSIATTEVYRKKSWLASNFRLFDTSDTLLLCVTEFNAQDSMAVSFYRPGRNTIIAQWP